MPGWLEWVQQIEELHPGFIYLESSDLFGGGWGEEFYLTVCSV